MVLVLKIKLGEDTRRITVENVPTYNDLVQLCEKLFSSKSNFVVKYLDDDEDMVTMSSDIELQEALNVIKQQQTNVLRLFLSEETKKTTEVPKPANSSNPSPQQQPSTTFPFPDFSNSPFAQYLNPQMISSFLSNPELMAQASQFMQKLNPQTVNPIADLTTMLQNLGLQQPNPTQTPSQQGQQSTSIPNLEQVLGNLSQFLGNFANGLPQFVGGEFGGHQHAPKTPNNCRKSEEDDTMIHSGVVCDGCGKRGFSGIRFKCTVCPDFDLCEVCEAKRFHDPNHPFTRITKPINYGRGCPYFRPGCSSRPVKPPMCGTGTGFGRDTRFLARFVEDVTVPDGTISPPNIHFSKIWKLRNEGNVAWPEGTRLSFVGGDRLSSQESVQVPSVLPGHEVNISVDMKSPSNAGRYVSYWRLCQPDGNRFGQRVWIDLLVIPSTEKPSSNPIQTPIVQEQQSMEVEQPKSTVPQSTVPEPIVPKPVVPEQTVPESTTPVRPPPSIHVQQLLDMGFSDRDHVEELLAKNNNDILRTVQDLLNGK